MLRVAMFLLTALMPVPALGEPPAQPTPAPPERSVQGRPLEALPKIEHDEIRSRAAWERGARAYRDGRFVEAIASFEEAFRYSARSGPLFSLGQVHRRRWETDHDHTQRELAIRRYQQYLEMEPEGRRRLEAERFIAELGRLSELEGLGEPARIFTRLSLSSPTEGATVSLDGAPPRPLPVVPDVEPGPHEFVVSAPGFYPKTRRLEIPEGSTVTLEVELDAIPARLWVDAAPDGSDLYVDGQRVARLPRHEGLTVAPGLHQIGVAHRGRSLFVREIEFGRGQEYDLEAPLEVTGQRKIAYAALALGAAGIVAGATLTGLAIAAQQDARAIEELKNEDGSILIEQERQRRQRIDDRDSLRTAAIATGVTGLVLTTAGILVHLTDRPPIASQLQPPSRARLPAPRRLTSRPVLSSRYAGLSMAGSF